MPTTTKQPNERLAALLHEAGMSSKGLAKRMTALSQSDGGEPIAPSHTSVDRWLSGATSQPKQRTCDVMATVLSAALNRPVSMDELGYAEPAAENNGTALARSETSAPAATDERADDTDSHETPLIEQHIGDANRSVHNRVHGNITGAVIQIGGDHHGDLRL